MGESKKAFAADKDVTLRTHVGGQAVIEGVMMRGRYNWALAVRRPDGSIYTEQHDLASGKEKNAWMYWPIVRGCRAFVESMVIGYKALSISSEHAFDFEDDQAQQNAQSRQNEQDAQSLIGKQVDESKDVVETSDDERDKQAADICAVSQDSDAELLPVDKGDDDQERLSATSVYLGLSMIVGILLGIGIFVVAPAWLSNLVFGEQAMNSAAWNIFDGVVRVAIFIAYIWLISLMKDIKRLFGYHGAEHKTIHCFEHGLELTPENAIQFPRLHVRCGTAFMIMVMIIAIFVYTALGHPINSLVDLTHVMDGPLRFTLIVLTRIILMPIIAGLSYEVTVKWAGQRPDNRLVRIILWPGMQMQRLTTNPPDESMLECAIAAMQLVLEREQRVEADKTAEATPMAQSVEKAA